MRRILLYILPLIMLAACKDNSDDIQSSITEDWNRGTLVAITQDNHLTPDAFVEKYAWRFPGMELDNTRLSELIKSLLDMSFSIPNIDLNGSVDLRQTMGRIFKPIMATNAIALKARFASEQNTLLPKYEMRTVSYTYRSLGYDGQPIVLSAAVAFPTGTGDSYRHTISEITINNHAWETSNKYMPSESGDITFLRALQNTAIVCPDYEGSGVDTLHYNAPTEVDACARHNIDAIRAAKEVLAQNGVLLADTFHTLNLGVSLGGEYMLDFHRYMDTKATQQEKDDVHLTQSYGGAGVTRPHFFFGNSKKEIPAGDTAVVYFAFNTLEGILELPSSKLGGYSAYNDFLTMKFKTLNVLCDGQKRNYLDVRRIQGSVNFNDEPALLADYHSAFQSDMLNEDKLSFDMSSPKAKALFSYLKTADLATGWNPTTNITYVWSNQDTSMNVDQQQSVYDNLSVYSDGTTCDKVKKQLITSADGGDPGHFIFCTKYYIKCITEKAPY